MTENKLYVYANTECAGVLTQDAYGIMSFAYSESWLNHPDRYPLSLSLPLTSTPYEGKALRPYFAGLLPEKSLLDRLYPRLGLYVGDDFSVLKAKGGECAGAVTFTTSEKLTKPKYRFIQRDVMEGWLHKLQRDPFFSKDTEICFLLSGNKIKIPTCITPQGDFAIPLGNAPGTHIIKVGSQEAIEREAFCLTLANKMGLDTVKFIKHEAKECPYLIIERYDRSIENGIILRHHQEDFCQALKTPPQLFCEREGGPTLRQCMGLLRKYSTCPAKDLMQLFTAVILNYILRNDHANAKNYSLLWKKGLCTLSPIYGMSPSEYPMTSPFQIGNNPQFHSLTRKDIITVAKQIGFSKGLTVKHICRLHQRIQSELNTIPFGHHFKKKIMENTSLLSNQESRAYEPLCL